ncbi:MAG: hypothetical protein EXS42_01750 [Lacunisphaera sp.]|nr:hypothetical protein [Lacunisphaera sp.]
MKKNPGNLTGMSLLETWLLRWCLAAFLFPVVLFADQQLERGGNVPAGNGAEDSSAAYRDANGGAGNEMAASIPFASFRIIFGLRDTSPRDWSGQVLPKPGQLLQVEGDRLRRKNEHSVGEGGVNFGTPAVNLIEPLFGEDLIVDRTSWICSSRLASMHGPTTEWHFFEQEPVPVIQQPSVLIHLRNDALGQPIEITTKSGNFTFVPRLVIPFRPASFLEGDVRVECVPRVASVFPRSNVQQDFPSELSATGGKVWVAWQEHDGNTDSVLVRAREGDSWGPVKVLVDKADVFRTQIGEDADKRIWVVWSMQVEGNWHLWGRAFDGKEWSAMQRLTQAGKKNVYHQVLADSEGRLWLIWQSTDEGLSQIFARCLESGRWTNEEQISEGVSAAGNNWWPALAAGSNGSVVVVWDGYAAGNYDVFIRRYAGGAWGETKVVAATDRFEAHPSVAIDNKNRVWIAWDESGPNWGKDTGFLVIKQETQLHESRNIRVACLDGDRWLEPLGDISHVFSPREFWELPYLKIDKQGVPWLFARHLVMKQPDTPLGGPIDYALWEIHATRYEGNQWTEPVCLPGSSGRNEMMPAAVAGTDGGLWAVWATDGRDSKTYVAQSLQIKLGLVESVSGSIAADLVQRQAPPLLPKVLTTAETEQIKAVRSYRIQHHGKIYSIFRGDLHRHTDNSLDGKNDGSLLDAYRYARDAAGLDYLGVSDHTDGFDDSDACSYLWWLNQKMADLFQIPNSFAAFYGYERSVPYPNGHRNIFFAKRGQKILHTDYNILGPEMKGIKGSADLYEYLHRGDGFSIPHTTGRTSGTDWRDHDSKVESIMEIYQGMRDTYEHVSAPRPKRLWSEWLDPSRPIPRASSLPSSPSFKPLGFAWKALGKGHHLGFIAASDHISTHISYGFLVAEHLTPESLLEAVRARRTYGATDNIILDARFVGSDGEHLMGDVFESSTPVSIKAEIVGTGEILQIDLIKNGEVVHTTYPARREVTFVYTDSYGRIGENYLYLRLIQNNGEIAWGSPIWVTYSHSADKNVK